jgi:hypothetical protein
LDACVARSIVPTGVILPPMPPPASRRRNRLGGLRSRSRRSTLGCSTSRSIGRRRLNRYNPLGSDGIAVTTTNGVTCHAPPAATRSWGADGWP